ncbi:damage-inducible protein DinB, partial [Klebsiella pneumoniae]|nr:damage-inducible protein DinB [Klebsiella pneumoniae]
MLHVLKQQYNHISSTRQTLFSFLEEIPLEKLHST